MWSCLPLLLLGLLRPSTAEISLTQQCETSTDGTIYQYSAKTLNGSQTVRFSDYVGKSYVELNALHEEMRPLGLTLLGFPCNQFGRQEPGQKNEILPGLKYVRPGNGFVPNFLLFEKGDVNGKDEQGVFTFLKNSCPPVGDTYASKEKLFWEPLKTNDIKWNFEKFLVGPDGKPVMRWHPSINISTIRDDIRKYLLDLLTQDVFN
ncbi:glutathione peroxidase 3 isoform X1 [Xyrichtys novacula]|uniref:Glutathione peroxidase n=1 Tax=Xyrichtys novacula TaxID=13765 RepID=A0AAV1FBM9_XYRNO|nr:glutathione peroxidase 3 isoform X1 [Xyrichtys novacula]